MPEKRVKKWRQNRHFGVGTAYLNASDRLHFFQASASWQSPGPVVSHTKKPAKNYEKASCCRQNRFHFGADSDLLCRRTNACIGCNGPAQSRFPSSGLGEAELCYLELNCSRILTKNCSFPAGANLV